MLQTIEAIIDEKGKINLLEKIKILKPKRAIVIILDEDAEENSNINTLLSEDALMDWNKPEEEKAWAHLQPVP